MLLSLLIFPAAAILWMLALDRCGLVQDQPPQADGFFPAAAPPPARALRPPTPLAPGRPGGESAPRAKRARIRDGQPDP